MQFKYTLKDRFLGLFFKNRRPKTELEQAMINPESVFNSPKDILKRKDIARNVKIEILKRWEYDARSLQVAEEESMSAIPGTSLDEIRSALHELQVGAENESSAPTKQAGS